MLKFKCKVPSQVLSQPLLCCVCMCVVCVCVWCVRDRLRQDCEAGARELGRLKERLLEQAVKYSRALEEQRNVSTRERELLSQVTHAHTHKQTHSTCTELSGDVL